MNATRQESWRAIPGYEGLYEVSDQGRVKSVERSVWLVNRWGQDMKRLVPERIRDLSVNQNGGHLTVTLHREGKRSRHMVHQLVLLGFTGEYPDGLDEIRHLDGDPTNNNLANLRYGTHMENMRDMADHGTHHNTSKSECKRGHPFDAINTYVRPDGKGRSCRACMKSYLSANGARHQRDYRSRQKENNGR